MLFGCYSKQKGHETKDNKGGGGSSFLIQYMSDNIVYVSLFECHKREDDFNSIALTRKLNCMFSFQKL